MNIKVQAATDPAIKRKLEGEWELHKRKAERAYQELKEDSARAKARNDIDVITFDLQQALPTPMLSTNVVFYKRQMWVYNFGIHDCGTDKGTMNMRDESIASRGSCEMASTTSSQGIPQHVTSPVTQTHVGVKTGISTSHACGSTWFPVTNIRITLWTTSTWSQDIPTFQTTVISLVSKMLNAKDKLCTYLLIGKSW